MALSIILFDIDRLKALNDTLGHLAGDQVITEIAGIAAAVIRDNDMLVRWGGDAFVILTLGDRDQAITIACRLRERYRHIISWTDILKVAPSDR
jgi:diguanylate cyclase (GGDEF)-like protein